MRLLAGELAPDAAPFNSDKLTVADGVYAGANGYRPIGQFSAITPALTAAFNGGGSFVASDGATQILAGTATNLYRFASGAWSSMIGALSANQRWFFTKFNDKAIAVYGGAPVDVNLVAGTAAALAGTPPSAALCATVRDFVVLGRTNGVLNAYAWSGFQDAAGWTAGVNQSGAGVMLSGGDITGLTGGEYGLVFQQFAIKRLSYIGPPTVWQVDEISANIGCIAAGTVAQAGRLAFFLSHRGFYMTDGNDVKPIGAERIDREFLKYPALDIKNLCYATVDPKAHVVAWVMPNKVWLYNWQLDRWTTLSTTVKAAFQAVTAGMTLEEVAVAYPDLDAMTISLDDARFRGGDPLIFFVTTADVAGVMAGDNIAASLEWPFVEFVPGREARLSQARLIGDATAGVTLHFDSRARLGDVESLSSFQTIQASGDMPVRASGRFLKPKLHLAASTAWQHIQGLDLDLVAAGGRR